MTICAYKDGILAADCQITAFNTIYRASKMVRLMDGGMAAGCGLWHRAWAGLEWLRDGNLGKPPSIKEACLLIVKGDGSLHIAEDDWPEFPLIDTFTAIGCGTEAAIASMRSGMSAIEAVQHVIGQDAMCGVRVQSLSLRKLEDFDPVKNHSTRAPKLRLTRPRKKAS